MAKNRRVTGRRENSKGANTHYRLSGGQIVTRAEGVRLQKEGKIPTSHIYKRNGVEYLRDNPDSSTRDNIDEQPLV